MFMVAMKLVVVATLVKVSAFFDIPESLSTIRSENLRTRIFTTGVVLELISNECV